MMRVPFRPSKQPDTLMGLVRFEEEATTLTSEPDPTTSSPMEDAITEKESCMHYRL